VDSSVFYVDSNGGYVRSCRWIRRATSVLGPFLGPATCSFR
jgi:hypothetical protein